MRMGWRTLLGLGMAALAVSAHAVAPEERHRILVTQDLDVSAFESAVESSNTVRLAFDGEGGLVVVYVVEDDREDIALVWRRISPDGVLSPPARIPLPDLARRIEKLQAVAVASDGTTYVAHRTFYRKSWEDYGPLDETPTEILRIAQDGSVLGRLSLGASADRLVLLAHDGVVDVAFDAELTGFGGLAVYWRRVDPDGTFAGEPVRLSAPPRGTDPNLVTGIWDVFAGAAADGTTRVLYRRVEGLWDGYNLVITAGPEVFWHSLSQEAGASPPVSLGQVPDGVDSWKAAFAPDGTVCVCMYRDLHAIELGTSFPQPILVSPQGEVRTVDAEVFPRLLCTYPGEQFGVGADAGSRFHVAAFATSAFRIRPDRNRHIAPSLFFGTMDPTGATSPPTRLRIREPQYVWDYRVGADGTRMIAGDRAILVGRRHARRSGEEVTVLFADHEGARLGRATFRNQDPTYLDQPVLGASYAGGLQRYAAAWSSWLVDRDATDKPDHRSVRVVLFR